MLFFSGDRCYLVIQLAGVPAAEGRHVDTGLCMSGLFGCLSRYGLLEFILQTSFSEIMLITSFHFPSDSLVYNLEFRVIDSLEPSTAALTK